MRVHFRGGRFDGRSRDFGPEPMPVIELHAGGGKAARYVRTQDAEGDAVVYEVAEGDGSSALPFAVYFAGGPFAGRGRHFAAEPAATLVIPIAREPEHPDHGWFARYKRLDPPMPGRPFLYTFVDKFQGER